MWGNGTAKQLSTADLKKVAVSVNLFLSGLGVEEVDDRTIKAQVKEKAEADAKFKGKLLTSLGLWTEKDRREQSLFDLCANSGKLEWATKAKKGIVKSHAKPKVKPDASSAASATPKSAQTANARVAATPHEIKISMIAEEWDVPMLSAAHSFGFDGLVYLQVPQDLAWLEDLHKNFIQENNPQRSVRKAMLTIVSSHSEWPFSEAIRQGCQSLKVPVLANGKKCYKCAYLWQLGSGKAVELKVKPLELDAADEDASHVPFQLRVSEKWSPLWGELFASYEKSVALKSGRKDFKETRAALQLVLRKVLPVTSAKLPDVWAARVFGQEPYRAMKVDFDIDESTGVALKVSSGQEGTGVFFTRRFLSAAEMDHERANVKLVYKNGVEYDSPEKVRALYDAARGLQGFQGLQPFNSIVAVRCSADHAQEMAVALTSAQVSGNTKNYVIPGIPMKYSDEEFVKILAKGGWDVRVVAWKRKETGRYGVFAAEKPPVNKIMSLSGRVLEVEEETGRNSHDYAAKRVTYVAADDPKRPSPPSAAAAAVGAAKPATVLPAGYATYRAALAGEKANSSAGDRNGTGGTTSVDLEMGVLPSAHPGAMGAAEPPAQTGVETEHAPDGKLDRAEFECRMKEFEERMATGWKQGLAEATSSLKVEVTAEISSATKLVKEELAETIRVGQESNNEVLLARLAAMMGMQQSQQAAPAPVSAVPAPASNVAASHRGPGDGIAGAHVVDAGRSTRVRPDSGPAAHVDKSSKTENGEAKPTAVS